MATPPLESNAVMGPASTASIKVLVVGGASLNAMIHLERLPEPRAGTVFSQGFHETVGGTGAGKALNLRRLGFDVLLHLVLGDDEAGRTISDFIETKGVRTLIDRTSGNSERHVNLMAQDGARISIYVAYADFEPKVDWLRLEAAVRDADVICLNIINYCRRLIPAIKAAGKPIWCDIHDWDGTNAYHLDFVAAADYLFMSSDQLPGYRALMTKLHANGKRLVVCTHGRHGASALSSDGAWVDVPIAEGYVARDTNGAGDAFMAGAMYGLLSGRPPLQSLQLGAIAAGMCVESLELFSEALSTESLEAEFARRHASA